MLALRERLFRCTYSPSSGSGSRLAHVAAWDASEALQLFQVELRDDGVDEQGTIEAVPLSARTPPRRASYRPARH